MLLVNIEDRSGIRKTVKETVVALIGDRRLGQEEMEVRRNGQLQTLLEDKADRTS